MSAIIHTGDCLDVLRTMPDNSVAAIVTDPPYGISFMAKKWDYDVPSVEVWAECLRVLKPGGHLLAFAGTRTQHRMAVRIEDAGFELRDMVTFLYDTNETARALIESLSPWQLKMLDATFGRDSMLAWVYGSGFPKSLDVSKAIDKAAGVERELVGVKRNFKGDSGVQQYAALGTFNQSKFSDITAPATEAARQREGWGTALKPALEPITVARKPLAGTVAANVLAHGTGALNIDGCRINGEPVTIGMSMAHRGGRYAAGEGGRGTSESYVNTTGRWPANVIHDGSEEVLAGFPDAPGQLANESRAAPSAKTSGIYGPMKRQGEPSQDNDNEGTVGFKMKPGARRLDSGSAARFFYCAKADSTDRNAGLGDAHPERRVQSPRGDERVWDIPGSKSTPRKNYHPTVKPHDLMRYLCRLVTPPGGVVLDPFAGSGSTGRAAIAEGFDFIGIELSPEYADIARARLTGVQHGIAFGVDA